MKVNLSPPYVTFITLLACTTTARRLELCPQGCECNEWLIVDCQKCPHDDPEQLTEELDSLLSSNLTYGHLTSLSIVNTSLTHVPRSVCRLTTLTELHLDYNRLVRLPDNCLTNFTALTLLTASKNSITELPDGIFDGLDSLVTLSLWANRISAIGLRVFNASAMLTSLKFVDLRENRIKTLEPWVFYVGVNGKPAALADINLGSNNVSVFTNKMGLNVKCRDVKPVNLRLELSHNPLRHISDIVLGWNMSASELFCLIKRPNHITVDLKHTYLHCDCVDFGFYRTAFAFPRMSLLNEAYCKTPDRLYKRRISGVALEEFDCELTERCPPCCRCVHRPANATLHIRCSNTNLTVLPLQLPDLPKSYTKYKLDFSSNKRLHVLQHRDYFVNTTILDASNCGIEAVENWTELFQIKQIYLNGNRLALVPRSFAYFNMSTDVLSLYNNSWSCSCDRKWIIEWLNSLSQRLLKPSDTTCASPARLAGRSILHISGDEFCVNPVTRAITLSVSSFTGAVVTLLLAGGIVYRLRVKLYTKWRFHPFDRDECAGENLAYDVFLSCSSDDNLPHGNKIRQQLEERGYRVCYPPRDFLAGESIYDNICTAVVGSKRTLCVLTANFLQSSYCMHEFDSALHHNIVVKRKKRLIVLMALDSPAELYANDESDTASLRHYLRQYTYIDYTSDDWFDNLLYALPLHGMDRTAHRGADEDQIPDTDVPLLLVPREIS